MQRCADSSDADGIRLKREKLQEQWNKRKLEQRAENNKLAQKFVEVRDEDGLSTDPDRFAGAFQKCIEDWQSGCKQSKNNVYVWRGPSDVSVADIIREGKKEVSREPLYFLERCIDTKKFPEVTEIKRCEGFSYCLGEDNDSQDYEHMNLGAEKGRAELVMVEVIPSDDEFCEIVDAFTLLEEMIPTKKDYTEEGTRATSPGDKGCCID